MALFQLISSNLLLFIATGQILGRFKTRTLFRNDKWHDICQKKQFSTNYSIAFKTRSATTFRLAENSLE